MVSTRPSGSRGCSAAARAGPGPVAAPVEPGEQVRAVRRDGPRESLTVAPVRNSRLVELRFSSTDPTFAADRPTRMPRRTSSRTWRSASSRRRRPATGSASQLAEQRKKVEAERGRPPGAISETHDAVTVDDSAQNIVVQRLTDLNAAADQGQDRNGSSKEAQYNQLKTLPRARRRVDTFPAVLANELHPEAEVRDRRPPASAGAAGRAVWRAPSGDDQGPHGDRSRPQAQAPTAS